MRGTLLIFSGPSGVGKGTVVKELRRRSPNVWLSVSYTTREPRDSDIPGVTYHFISDAAFRELIAHDAFLEHACYSGNFYGTPLAPIEQHLAAGDDVVLEIEAQGALQVMALRPDAVSVFVAAPSFAELERRLRDRGDTKDVERRLAAARWEYTQAPKYDYIVVNDRVEACADEVMAILTADKCRAKYRQSIVKEDNFHALPPDV